jgi:hypothetical protein
MILPARIFYNFYDLSLANQKNNIFKTDFAILLKPFIFFFIPIVERHVVNINICVLMSTN